LSEQPARPRAPADPGRLAAISAAVVDCRACPRLVAYRERVAAVKVRRFRADAYWGRPVPAFGDPGARLLVVGLAPAAHGANRTGRVFTGDGSGGSGDWVAAGLHAIGCATRPVSRSADDGLALAGALVTSAVRCAPPDNRPAPDELRRCRAFLASELAALPRLAAVLALGRVAYEAVLAAWPEARRGTPPRPAPAFAHGAEVALPGGVRLLASYHPSRQNTQTGRLTRAMWLAVFRRASALSGGGRRREGAPESP
jgi:uracil-DNA glycosylase family 4